MNKLNEVLKNKNIKPIKYQKKSNVTIIETREDKYVYKNTKIDQKVIEYLKSRNFDYIPLFLESKEFQLYKYIKALNIPDEKKILDLAKIMGLLHSKTTFYTMVDNDEYIKLYEDLDGNLNYLYNYYTDLINVAESKVYPSPSEQLLSANISIIYNTISDCKKRLEHYHHLIKNKTRKRNVIMHGNINLSHFIESEKPYLISWDKAKIGSPVFDMYKLYRYHALDFDFISILKKYESVYPFTKDEKVLFEILISMPELINLKGSEYDRCIIIDEMLEKIKRTKKIASPETSKER